MAVKEASGFTLVSVMVAIVVMYAGMFALTQALVAATATHSRAGNRTVALAIARGYLEEIRARSFENLEPEAPVSVNTRGVVDAAGKYTRSVEVRSARHNLKHVTVRVRTPRATKPVELDTFLYAEGG
jgi:type IV pilus assembly protein PilV